MFKGLGILSGIDKFHFFNIERGFVGNPFGSLEFNGIHVLEPICFKKRSRRKTQQLLAVAGNYCDWVHFYDMESVVEQHANHFFDFGNQR